VLADHIKRVVNCI